MTSKTLEEIFVKNGTFVDGKGIKVENFIYCGESSLKGVSKKRNSSQLYEYAEIIKQGREFSDNFNAFLVEQPKSNRGKLFGIISPKYYNYFFKFYRIIRLDSSKI